MNEWADKPVVIVGAGVSGLSLANFLAVRNIPSVVIEKDDSAGGLARSFHAGAFTFDIGPHRFHTEVPRVSGFIRETLGASLRIIPRTSMVCFRKQFYPWPLHPSYTLLRFPPRIALSVFLDLFHLYRKTPGRTFKDQIVNMYGMTLYKHFFEGYSSKFLGIVPELTHPDWAKTGIDRAIIDNRLKLHNLGQLIWRALLPRRPPELRFIYPAGGCGRFTDELLGRYLRAGGEFLSGKMPDALETEGGRIVTVRVGDRSIAPSLVVWTGTLHSLTDLLHLPRPNLRYLALVCYFLMLSEGPPLGFQWSYHGASEVLFSRVSVPRNFDPGNTPEGRRSMCVEVSGYEDDDVYQRPENYLDRVLSDLKSEGLLLTSHEILDVRIERLPWSYPAYHIDYKEELDRLNGALAGYGNLIRAGRLGLFWYNNMDQCIDASFDLADQIAARLSGRPA